MPTGWRRAPGGDGSGIGAGSPDHEVHQPVVVVVARGEGVAEPGQLLRAEGIFEEEVAGAAELLSGRGASQGEQTTQRGEPEWG
jgi:hypothetical protein